MSMLKKGNDVRHEKKQQEPMSKVSREEKKINDDKKTHASRGRS